MAAGWPNPIGLYLLARSDSKITKVATASGTVLAPFTVRAPDMVDITVHVDIDITTPSLVAIEPSGFFFFWGLGGALSTQLTRLWCRYIASARHEINKEIIVYVCFWLLGLIRRFLAQAASAVHAENTKLNCDSLTHSVFVANGDSAGASITF